MLGSSVGGVELGVAVGVDVGALDALGDVGAGVGASDSALEGPGDVGCRVAAVGRPVGSSLGLGVANARMEQSRSIACGLLQWNCSS